MRLRIAKYNDLVKIPTKEEDERFIVVNFFSRNIKFGQEYTCASDDMANYFDGKIIVRKTVARRLSHANKSLQEKYPGLTLFITYGYRTLEIQTRRFERELQRCKAPISAEKKKEFTHKKIAYPEVAGHPTGGAVDITIFDNKKNTFLDMGCKISDFSKSADNLRATFSRMLNKIQKNNRKLLHDILFKQGFCPFYEEWWHFSYGDKEWAWFYNKNYAIYDQIKIKEVKF